MKRARMGSLVHLLQSRVHAFLVSAALASPGISRLSLDPVVDLGEKQSLRQSHNTDQRAAQPGFCSTGIGETRLGRRVPSESTCREPSFQLDPAHRSQDRISRPNH